MAATTGVVKLVARGRTFTVQLYIPDAVATYIGFAAGGLAGSGSPTFYVVPEDCVLTDVSLTTAPTAVGVTWLANGAAINGGTARWNDYLTSNNQKIPLAIPLSKGTQLGGLQF